VARRGFGTISKFKRPVALERLAAIGTRVSSKAGSVETMYRKAEVLGIEPVNMSYFLTSQAG
jgi:hypothetical protein